MNLHEFGIFLIGYFAGLVSFYLIILGAIRIGKYVESGK